MRFSLRTIFLLTLGAAILLAVPWPTSWTPVLAALGIGLPLTVVTVLNVACVGALMGVLAAIDWQFRRLRRQRPARAKN